MLQEFVGKEVSVIVAFSSRLVDAGSVPAYYVGKIIGADGDFVKMIVTSSNASVDRISFHLEDGTGLCILNQKYIISIFEKD